MKLKQRTLGETRAYAEGGIAACNAIELELRRMFSALWPNDMNSAGACAGTRLAFESMLKLTTEASDD